MASGQVSLGIPAVKEKDMQRWEYCYIEVWTSGNTYTLCTSGGNKKNNRRKLWFALPWK
jgi:hypothetical protein